MTYVDGNSRAPIPDNTAARCGMKISVVGKSQESATKREELLAMSCSGDKISGKWSVCYG
jgi:hypothetical protein